MKKKIFSVIGLVSLFMLFTFASSVSAANLDVLNLDISTDKSSYNYDEAITSLIEITNTSETNLSENIQVTVEIPEELELVDENESLVWIFDTIDIDSFEELSFRTKLSSPPEVPIEPEDINEDEDVSVVIEDTSGTGTDETGTKAPQTGDESSAFMYIMILIVSIALAIVGFILIKNKKTGSVGALIVALLLISPALISNAEEINDLAHLQVITETYSVEVAGENYEFAVTITAEVPDLIESIDAEPAEITLSPETSKIVNVTGTKTSGAVVEINDHENLSFEVSEADKVQVTADTDGLKIYATDAAEDGEEITVIATYTVNGEQLTTTILVNIELFKGVLNGQVFDAFTEAPINEAVVTVVGEAGLSEDIQTNEQGEYDIELASGIYTVTASADGYITETEIVEVAPGNTSTSDLNLYLVSEEYAGEGTASGKISDALTGNGVEGVEIKVVKGKNNSTGDVVETITTDATGNYSIDLPGGNYTLLISADDYISTTKNIISIGGTETENQNATITPVLSEEEIRIVLTWNENPRDLDSHLTGPKASGDRFQIYFANKNYSDEDSEINLDLDDTSSFGPETVTVLKKVSNGTYTYGIFNYTGRSVTDDNKLDLAKSGAKVEVYEGSTLVKTFNVPTNKEGNMWKVFNIVDGEIVTVNKVESFDSHPNVDNLTP